MAGARTRVIGSVAIALGALGACSNGGGSADAGTTKTLGANPSIPQTCQSCLSQSTSNECSSQSKSCTNDSVCVTLNECVNKCANINASCVSACGNAASANAITEWNAWAQCTCGTCASQCGATFCSIGADAGADTGTGNDAGTCVADDQQCSATDSCCTFCASDGFCGCMPSNESCVTDSECCSGSCDLNGSGTCF